MNNETDTTMNVETNQDSATEQDTVKTYTEEEVQALLQSETDRRVTQALAKQAKKQEAKLKEAEKLAQMNEQEKYEYQLQQREAQIAEKERELALAENKAEAAKILAEKGLAASLVDFIVAEDADTMNQNIKTLEQAFKASVKAEVDKRLASNTPKRNLPLDKPIDKAAFMKMSVSELAQLRQENPDLYQQLSNS